LYGIFSNNLGPDPAESLSSITGEWAFYFLLITLSITPVSKFTNLVVIASYRRMVGLYSFFYTSLHLLVFIALWLAWDLQGVLVELKERPYIAAGFIAWLLLVPLAVTSTRKWRQRLGGTWKKIHRLIYVATSVALIHIVWQVRSDLGEFWLYLVIFILLMLSRTRIFVTKVAKKAAA